jgi:hypothetical protein
VRIGLLFAFVYLAVNDFRTLWVRQSNNTSPAINRLAAPSVHARPTTPALT